MYVCQVVSQLLTFDVVLEHGSVVVPPGGDSEGGGGVGLAARIPRDDLNLPAVRVAAFGNVKVPHAVIHELMAASLKFSRHNMALISSFFYERLRESPKSQPVSK